VLPVPMMATVLSKMVTLVRLSWRGSRRKPAWADPDCDDLRPHGELLRGGRKNVLVRRPLSRP
jgi:hypothetical protein